MESGRGVCVLHQNEVRGGRVVIVPMTSFSQLPIELKAHILKISGGLFSDFRPHMAGACGKRMFYSESGNGTSGEHGDEVVGVPLPTSCRVVCPFPLTRSSTTACVGSCSGGRDT